MLTKKDETLFRDEYNKWLRYLADRLINYREGLVITMCETDLKYFNSPDDFIDFARQGILHETLIIVEEENAIDKVNEILSDEEDDTELT